jgi:hypothetical protein
MKKLITLVAVPAFSLMMLAQDTNSQSNQSQSPQSQSQTDQTTPSQNSQSNQGVSGNAGSSSSGANSGQRMSGKVSSHGKKFTDDAGKSYKVDNPDSLQNYENQHVVVLVQTDPNTGDVTITAVQPPQ